MRKLAIILVALAVPSALLLHRASVAATISYAPGWDLVSGPTGSHLVGATGDMYTAQPSDTQYQVLPSDSALTSGWGYWAYFPSGGSLDAAADTTRYTVVVQPGEWIIVGNPSAQAPATISGADSALIYDPAGGYQQATEIPPGQGALVTSASEAEPIIITPAQPATSTPTASPSPSPSASPGGAQPSPTPSPSASAPSGSSPVTSFQGLRGLALTASDLPGYILYKEQPYFSPQPSDVDASYLGLWESTTLTQSDSLVVGNGLIADKSTATAMIDVVAIMLSWSTDPENYNVQTLTPAKVGDQSAAISYNWNLTNGTKMEDYLFVFRRGRVVCLVEISGFPGSGSLGKATSLATKIDSRLATVNTAP